MCETISIFFNLMHQPIFQEGFLGVTHGVREEGKAVREEGGGFPE